MADRFAVVHRGETGFGIGMSSENYITKLSGLNSEVLEVGEQVVSVDGEELAEGQLVGDFIRAHPRAQYTLGLRVAPVQVPTPSLGELMKTMLSSPEMRGAITKMTTQVIKGSAAGGGAQALLGAAPQRAMLGGGGGGDGTVGEASGTQLQTTAEADAALDAAIESTIGALLESDGFGRLAESVVESEGVQRLVHNVESGDLCGDATTPSEMTACLLEGGTLLRSVSDATCAALKVSAAECEEVHRQAEALLGRFGLGGGGRFGALVMRALLVLGWRGAAAAAAALAAAAVGGCWWCWRQRGRRRSKEKVR